jgi:regulatory protein
VTEEDVEGCYRKAVDLLARRPHFREELKRKLADRGFAPVVVEHCLERLSAEKYLDDETTARDFARERLRRRPEGPRKLRSELGRRGVAAEVIDATLEELFPDGDLELARDAAARWRRNHEADAAALARHLDRKGFSKGAIWEVVRGDE